MTSMKRCSLVATANQTSGLRWRTPSRSRHIQRAHTSYTYRDTCRTISTASKGRRQCMTTTTTRTGGSREDGAAAAEAAETAAAAPRATADRWRRWPMRADGAIRCAFSTAKQRQQQHPHHQSSSIATVPSQRDQRSSVRRAGQWRCAASSHCESVRLFPSLPSESLRHPVPCRSLLEPTHRRGVLQPNDSPQHAVRKEGSEGGKDGPLTRTVISGLRFRGCRFDWRQSRCKKTMKWDRKY